MHFVELLKLPIDPPANAPLYEWARANAILGIYKQGIALDVIAKAVKMPIEAVAQY
ncbi:hypothetical protein [Paenibacillus agricola]|uniref:hypothetical protein n=1 Tax=Paenibacillus agricola TaxID=2716264 RepID=UPI001A9D659E|nr:hypothetical protein [Paenibacillus agricola]